MANFWKRLGLEEPEMRDMLLEIGKDILPGVLLTLGIIAAGVYFIVKAVRRRRAKLSNIHPITY